VTMTTNKNELDQDEDVHEVKEIQGEPIRGESQRLGERERDREREPRGGLWSREAASDYKNVAPAPN